MNREQAMERRLKMLDALGEAVSAMRSLSAHHFRVTRQTLPAARQYRTEVENALAEIGIRQPRQSTAPAGLLLVVSELGLCGDYNSELVHFSLQEIESKSTNRLYCVGQRPRGQLERYQMSPDRWYPAPTSVAGMQELLLRLSQDIFDDYDRQMIGSLFVVSARFEGAGKFKPQITQLLPITSPRKLQQIRPSQYQSREYLTSVAVREYFYIVLYELLLDALAAEHGMRLVSTNSARQWIDRTSLAVRRSLSASRREAATQEVLDIVAGAAFRSRTQFGRSTS